ncbi:MAG: leucine-rich repeat protein [Lentisphaeria bacterium]|nr:leucine-rich repeat protein [Lentisphaeria bacterium]
MAAAKIEAGIFCGCKSFTSIITSEHVTQIKESAFQDCKSLTSLNIPDCVKKSKIVHSMVAIILKQQHFQAEKSKDFFERSYIMPSIFFEKGEL